jgi:hypothetical protein
MMNLLKTGTSSGLVSSGRYFIFTSRNRVGLFRGGASREASVPESLKSHFLFDLDLHDLRVMNGDLDSAKVQIFYGLQDEVQEGEGMGFLFGIFTVRK